MTYSIKQQSQIREILQNNYIDYTITINRNSPSAFSHTRMRTGTFGQKPDLAYEYIFYVHKDNYGLAKSLI